MDFAERLGLWLNAFDAIRLQQAQQAIRAATAAPRGARKPPRLADDLAQARAVLARAIARDPLQDAEPEAGYAPWRDRHLELQRQMDLLIGPLREHAREALGAASLRLRQLAALDATLQEVLAARTQALLPALPALLEQRHRQLKQADELDRFADDWRQALLAELELRLAPVAGLVEALKNESEPGT